MSFEPENGEPMRLVVVGAAGRMGRTLVRLVSEHPGLRLHAAIEREGSDAIGRDAGELAGAGVLGMPVAADVAMALRNADGVIDFSTPATSRALAKAAAAGGLVHVIGTTGCSPDDDAAIATAAGAGARIVKSGNMSLGVNLVALLVEQAARALPAADFDIEILEMHHRHKVDAPSGTALLLGQAAAEGRGVVLADTSVRARDGHTGARPAEAIGFATLRGGSVIGDHQVIFAGTAERIEIGHRAEDRSVFGQGALAAALWARHRAPGLYSMRDVLGFQFQPKPGDPSA